MTGITILAMTKLLMVYSYKTPFTPVPQIEIVATCNQGQVRATDIDWKSYREFKNYYTVKDKRGEKNKCIYLK